MCARFQIVCLADTHSPIVSLPRPHAQATTSVDKNSLSITATSTQEVFVSQAIAGAACKLTLEQRRRRDDNDNDNRLLSQQAAAATALARDSGMPPQQRTGWLSSSAASESISRSNSEGLHETKMETMVWNLLKDELQQQQAAACRSIPNTTLSPSFHPPSGFSGGGYHSPDSRPPVAGGSPIAAADPALAPVPPPSNEALQMMARLCLEHVLSRSGGIARRTELGIVLRDVLGPAYQKGWVNVALAELEREGHGLLTPDGVFFRASSPLLNAMAKTRMRNEGVVVPAAHIATNAGSSCSSSSNNKSSSSSSRRGKRGFFLIDGGYYEWLQWHILQGRVTTHAIDVRLLVQRLENMLGLSFVRRLYVQSTETGARGPLHKMLEASAGFEVELHRRRDSPSLPPHRGVGVAMTAHVMSSTFKAAFDALVVLTGGASDLVPAFRMAQAENDSRYRIRQRVQEVVVLGGTHTSPAFSPYLYRPVDGSAFIFESLMAACVVPKSELGRVGGNISISSSSFLSPRRKARSLSPPIASSRLPKGCFENIFSAPPPPSSEAPSEGLPISSSSFQQPDLRNPAAHDVGSVVGSPFPSAATKDITLILSLNNTNSSGSGGGAGVGGRPRRWCNFGHRCKYVEDVEANVVHFQRFAHVCPHDTQCPFVLNYAVHRSTEEGRAHFLMWKHSCPHGLDCQYFAQPDKHRRHIEFFTHKTKVLNAAAAAVAQQQQQQQQQRQQAQQRQQVHQHQSLDLQDHHFAALSLSPSASPLLVMAARAPQPLPATLNETELLLSRFAGDWDPEMVSQMLQQHNQQQSQHHYHQQQIPIPRPPGLHSQHSSNTTHSSSSPDPLNYPLLVSGTSGVEEEVSSQSSAGAATSPSRSPNTGTSNFW
eukprot:evm.model.NODE_34240_length_32379_cov_28.507706.8